MSAETDSPLSGGKRGDVDKARDLRIHSRPRDHHAAVGMATRMTALSAPRRRASSRHVVGHEVVGSERR